MLQLDSTFNEKAYGASSFTDFVEKLQKADYVEVTGGEGRYMIRMKGAARSREAGAKPEEAIPLLRDVLETHRLEVDNGVAGRRAGRVGEAGAPRLRLAAIRLPGIQRAAELRAGQAGGAHQAG